MSLSSSLSAGVAGLQANATRLAVISDNIANASTAGYRRGEVEFGSLVLPGRPGTYAAAGVRADAFRDIAGAGTLIGTSRALDLAVAGRGFLPVTEIADARQGVAERSFLLTPTGGFARDAEGFLTTRNGLALMGWPTLADGGFGPVLRDGAGDLEPVRVTPFLTNVEPTTDATLGVNLPARASEAGADGAPYSTVIEYFDGVGRSRALEARFEPDVPAAGASNAWTLTFYDDAGDPAVPVARLALDFDASPGGAGALDGAATLLGNAYDPVTGRVEVPVADGAISVFLGRPGARDGLTQIDADFAPVGVDANGAPAGSLASLEIDEAGFLRGVYDTGASLSLYRIPVADVPNPDALTQRGGEAFALSAAAGRPFLWDAGTGPAGRIQGFSLQESTVDIARELTGLIETQRAYASNATVVQTVDEMLQETTNLKR